MKVRELVHDADGTFRGEVLQTRDIIDGCVIQTCAPDVSLTGHPMERFRGRHEFALEKRGRLRRYLGPAVLGSGVDHGGAILGQGLWPDFGYSFTSYAVDVAENLQLTGGVFHRAGVIAARIVGVAALEEAPELRGPTRPDAIASRWSGRLRTTDTTGELLDDRSTHLRYDGCRVEGPDQGLTLEPLGDALSVTGRIDGKVFTGFGKSYGWLTAFEGVTDDASVDWIELLDPQRGHLVGIRRWVALGYLERVDIWRLRPEDT